jgi:hypothetical protein
MLPQMSSAYHRWRRIEGEQLRGGRRGWAALAAGAVWLGTVAVLFLLLPWQAAAAIGVLAVIVGVRWLFEDWLVRNFSFSPRDEDQ